MTDHQESQQKRGNFLASEPDSFSIPKGIFRQLLTLEESCWGNGEPKRNYDHFVLVLIREIMISCRVHESLTLTTFKDSPPPSFSPSTDSPAQNLTQIVSLPWQAAWDFWEVCLKRSDARAGISRASV